MYLNQIPVNYYYNIHYTCWVFNTAFTVWLATASLTIGTWATAFIVWLATVAVEVCFIKGGHNMLLVE